jgi:hypothetical protein
MSSLYLAMNAWQEILARTFDGFEMQRDANPDWLVNPSTNRRLKLDRFFPEAGVGVRFADLTGRGQRRQSEWELLESQQRDQTRVELCRTNDVQLAVVYLMEDPIKQLDGLIRVLSRASRVLAQGNRPIAEKTRWTPALSEARSRASDIRSRVAKDPSQMVANLAESWRDRETGAVSRLNDSDDSAPGDQQPAVKASPGDYANGQRVRHSHFGDGVITDLSGSGDDTTIAVLFDAAEPRNFLLSLVADKLEVIA